MTSVTKCEIKRIQENKSTNSEYLTFGFFDKGHGMKLEFIDWTQLQTQPDKPDYIRGYIYPWGSKIPVIDLKFLYDRKTTEILATSCLVIFEHCVTYKYYFAIAVEELSNVINLAGGKENEKSSLLISARNYLSKNPDATDWNILLSRLTSSATLN